MDDAPQPSCVDRYASAVDRRIRTTFGILGHYVGSKPWKTIAMALACTLVLMSGWSMKKDEGRSEKLWIPQGTQSQVDQA